MGRLQETSLEHLLLLLVHFYGQFLEDICLKAPGIYSASFWTSNFSILLWERPEPDISMISGFWDRSEPLFMDLNTPKYYKNKKDCGNIFNLSVNITFGNLNILQFGSIIMYFLFEWVRNNLL